MFFSEQVHPAVEEKTAITLLFGYFAGILEGEQPAVNERFAKQSSNWLKNQFVYVSTKGTNKQLMIRCKNSAEIGETQCCRVKMPMFSFNTKNHEQEFDLIVVAAGDAIKLKDDGLLGLTGSQRLKFRKGVTVLTGIDQSKERFCYEPLKYGKTQIRFEIVEACYSLTIRGCAEIGETEKQKLISGSTPNTLPPMDFKVPPPFTVMASPIPLEKIKVFFCIFHSLSTFC